MKNILLLLVLLVFGCGGGSTTSTTTYYTGQFIDEAVIGLKYTCSSNKEGFTNSSGEFNCLEGDTITFYINNLLIGNSIVKKVITPYDLSSDEETIINIAQLLQTIDSDNSSDTITIGENSFDENLSIADSDFDSKIDNLVDPVLAKIKLDTNIVTMDQEALTFDTIKGSSLNLQTAVIKDLSLITKGLYGSDISWSSSDTQTITTDGTVTNPTDDQNITITLTATLSKGEQIKTKTFTVTVISYVNPDIDNDMIPDDIEAFLGLDTNSSDQNHNGIIDGIDPDFGDPFYKNQWHIKARGTVVNNTNNIATIIGNDLGLDEVYHQYMGYNDGNPILVSVIDTGIDANHEDIKENLDLTHSRNVVTNSNDPTPTSSDNTHGTMVAGIIASRGFNNKGVRGIAPFAKISGFNWLENSTIEELENAWLNETSSIISSNSWGPSSGYYNGFEFDDILQQGVTTLRGGKGRIYIIAAGNDRDYRGNANLSNISNNSYVIAVAALNHENKYASYSNLGSNVLISGYSGEYYTTAPTIGTTTIRGEGGDTTWQDDVNKDYTYAMNGTSAATPSVAGCVALIMEACPNLGYRDVKYILAKTAKKIDTTNPSWIQNSAGLWHSIDYGYGLVDTVNAINMCKNGYTNLSQEKVITKEMDMNIAIPDNDPNGIEVDVSIDENITIEWVAIFPNIGDHTYQGDLELLLTSPSGTTTKLVQGKNILKSEGDSSLGFYDGNGRLSSTAFVDEFSNGTWKVKISDLARRDTGHLTHLKLIIKGH